jgi:hypothetical protein
MRKPTGRTRTVQFRLTAKEQKRLRELMRFYSMTASELVRALLRSAYSHLTPKEGKTHGESEGIETHSKATAPEADAAANG